MEKNFVEFLCKICDRSQQINQPRHAGICCNACATFFSRSLYLELTYICYNHNECFKEASTSGICCRKCRFIKCMSIGMPITRIKLPYLRISYNQAKTYAQTIDSLLLNAVVHPELLKRYLAKEDQTIFNLSYQTFTQSIPNPLSKRLILLTNLMEKYPINSVEGLPTLCFICVCRLKFPWLSEDESAAILKLQCDAFQKLEKEKLNISYVYHLIELGKQCLNIFNTFIYTK